MSKKEIIYLGFYSPINFMWKRVFSLAAVNKMNYISSVLVKNGYEVQIISPSWMDSESNQIFEPKKVIQIDNNIQAVMCPSWKTSSKKMRNVKILFTLVWIFLYLLVHTRKNKAVIVYHVPWLSIPVRLAKMIRGFKLILEVEEIYSLVWKGGSKFQKTEMRLINSADRYIFVSENLRNIVNKMDKKSLILYGSYTAHNQSKSEIHNQNIKLIYAGSIDKTKGGALRSVEVMRYLGNNYELIILGHGSKAEISSLENAIKLLNHEKGYSASVYLGTKHGNEYSAILSSCDIALNPQNTGDYMDSAFPSKIISYLSHNLRVITTPLKSVEQSELAKYLTFSDDDRPHSIANAVQSIDFSVLHNSIDIIEILNKNFESSMGKLTED